MLKINQNAVKFYRGENDQGEKIWATNPFSEEMQEDSSFTTKYVTFKKAPRVTQKERDSLMHAYCHLQEQNYQLEDFALKTLRDAYLDFFKDVDA